MPGTLSTGFVPSAIALGGVLIAAGMITLSRPDIDRAAASSQRFRLVSLLAIVTQGVHFVEEWRTGFATEFPGAFGLPAIEERAFVVFNVAWLVIWLLAVPGVRRGLRIALWPLWFLGLAAVLNAVAHPMLAMRVGAYFPGLVTAPLVGLAGAALIRELAVVTAGDASRSSA